MCWPVSPDPTRHVAVSSSCDVWISSSHMVNDKAEGDSMKDTYSKYGIEYIMWCMGLYAEDLAKLKEEDPVKHADVLHVRAMLGRSLAKAMR